MKLHRITTASAILLTALAVACSGGHGRGSSEETPTGEGRGATLSLKGSDTMVILAQRFAEGYMRSHPGTTIQVSGGGSGTGISALIDGTTDIADSSRPITERERTDLRARRQVDAHETRVALDALAIYVNEASTIPSLSLTQLSGIYRGEIRNWSEVGGPDAPIVLYSRENNSGTYAYFKEHVLGGADFAAEAQTLPGTAAVINAVSHDPNGIGYGGIGYASGVRVLPVAAEGREPIAPTLENAVSGAYPISRFLFMYTAGEPSGAAADLLAWVVTPEGQALVAEAGFYPLPAEGTAATVPAVPVEAPVAVPTSAPAPEVHFDGLGATGTGVGGS